jgi:hypothetical protein
VKCSRWTELVNTLKFHASLCRASSSHAQFRLLNAGLPIVIGLPDSEDAQRYSNLVSLLDGSPQNGTPLCRHIRDVTTQIKSQESQLRASGQKALVIIATDGEASDGEVADAMRPLKNLPVWVILRLCTDQNNVVNYWNCVDSELELDMDVIDDIIGEVRGVRLFM